MQVDSLPIKEHDGPVNRWSQRWQWTALVICICFMTSIMQTGCSTIKIQDHGTKPVNEYNYKVSTSDGLQIGVHPILDKEDCAKYFEADLLSSNIVAAFVEIENTNPDSSFIVYKDKICLSSGVEACDANKHLDKVASVSPGKSVSMVGAVMILISPIIAIFLLPIGTKMISNAAEKRHHFASCELQTQTLSPGERMHGFVYFPASAADITKDLAKIVFNVQNLSNHEMNQVELDFGSSI